MSEQIITREFTDEKSGLHIVAEYDNMQYPKIHVDIPDIWTSDEDIASVCIRLLNQVQMAPLKEVLEEQEQA